MAEREAAESDPAPPVLPPTPWERIWSYRSGPSYWLTRLLLLRLLGLVYLVAFATVIFQGPALFGEDGLLPAADFLDRVGEGHESSSEAFWSRPTLFWLSASDGFLLAAAWAGALLSLAVLAGFANVPILLTLWVLHYSFNEIGQAWYAFGWEMQLLETGFLAVFLVPLLDPRPLPRHAPPRPVIWLYRWLLFRIMLGAGLIKLRGAPCWEELTCLQYHYETQPVPNPLSALLHHMPAWLHAAGALFNHVVEIVLPWFVFGPRRARHLAGFLMLLFQLLLIASGNLSYLNWLTIVPILACFDDQLLRRLMPRRWVERSETARAAAPSPGPGRKAAVGILFASVALLSLDPIANLMSSRQAMNKSYNPLHLANTYGAFGGVGEVRYEIVFEGTNDPVPDDGAEWRAYELPCKPGDPSRRPCVITPYHYRLDWLLWFCAMSSPERYPWTIHLVAKLLEGDETLLGLFAHNPFPERPPRWIRVSRYRYRFAPLSADAWWERERIGTWIEPVRADDPRLRRILRVYGWSE